MREHPVEILTMTNVSVLPVRPPRPDTVAPKFENFPPELYEYELPQWVLWRYYWDGSRWTKPPYRADGSNASSTNPNDWLTGVEAQRAFEQAPKGQFDGVGFVLTEADPYVGNDLDHVFEDDDGTPAAWATPILQAAQRERGYIEFSPSGVGYHVIGRGKPRGKLPKKKNNAETYSTERYLTMTGRVAFKPDGPLGELAETLELMHARITFVDPDVALLEHARRAKRGAKFKKLFDDGDISAYKGDDSAADMALACTLAFWTAKDPGQMKRLMFRSALKRDKWKRADYIDRTIEKACLNCRAVYTPPVERPEQIAVREGGSPEAQDKTLAALVKHADLLQLYGNGGRLVRPSLVEREGFPDLQGKPRKVRSLELCAVSVANFAVDLTRIIAFTVMRRGQDILADCPDKLAKALFEANDRLKALPQIERISEVPVFDGTQLHAEPGLHGTTWVNAPPGIALPAKLSKDGARAALSRLTAVLGEFPYAADIDKAVALALLMTAVLRTSLMTAPGFLITKPSYGAGATFHAKLAALLATGREPAVMPFSHQHEGMRQLNAALITGRFTLILDNLPEGMALSDPLLAQVLSEVTLEVRELGTGRLHIADCRRLVIGNGVGVTVGNDLARRFLMLTLDPAMEAPESRTFKRPDLLAEVQADRAALLSAVYTITAAYLSQEERAPVEPLAGYAQWLRWVAEPLVWLGQADVVETSRMSAVADEKNSQIARVMPLLEQLCQMLGAFKGVSVKDIMMRKDHKVPSGWWELKAALHSVLGEATKARIYDELPQLDPARVGYWLRSVKRRVVGGWRIEESGRRDGQAMYTVAKL
jgi:hypothetical protein